MKKSFTMMFAAAAFIAVLLSACGSGSSAAPEQPSTGVSSSVVYSTANSATAPATAYSSVPATTSNKKNKSQNDKKSSATQPSTIKDPSLIPPNDITEKNINPNINTIENNLESQIRSLAVQSISLSQSEISLNAGETKQLTISYIPSNAAIKSCSVSADNSCASVTALGGTVTVKGVKNGTANITVTSHNGHTATCKVTVKGTIDDNTRLPHKELCTAANAERWFESIASYCYSTGMQSVGRGFGSEIIISTADDRGTERSFNEINDIYLQYASSQITAVTGGDYSNYGFECHMESLNGEYLYVIAISQLAERPEN